jgi:hypothetical protein
MILNHAWSVGTYLENDSKQCDVASRSMLGIKIEQRFNAYLMQCTSSASRGSPQARWYVV